MLIEFPKILDIMVDSDSNQDKLADIYAIGFEEIVDLNASNIVAASTDNAKACEYPTISTKKSISDNFPKSLKKGRKKCRKYYHGTRSTHS